MGGGNDGLWKARKTIMPFPDLPTNLGNPFGLTTHYIRAPLSSMLRLLS